MEASYGVGVANRYALLMDDDEVATSTSHGKGVKDKENASKGKVAPGRTNATAGAPSNKQQQTQAATKSTYAGNKVAPGNKPQQQQQHSKSAGKGVKLDSANNNNNIHTINNNQVNQARDRPPRRDPRPPRQHANDSHGNGPQKDSDEARKNRRNREDRGPLPTSNFTGEANVEGSGEGRTNRGPRNPKFFKGDRPPRTGGPRGVRSFGSDNRDGRGKPVFDRHSGSDKAGIKPVEKRDGAGAHNWGTYTDELEGQVAPEENRPEKTAAEETNDQGEVHADGEVEPAKEVEDEGPKEMTLQEYRKQLGVKKNAPKYKIRRAGEGEDNSQWKKTYLLKKDDEDEEEIVIEEIEVLKEETRHNKKKVIDIDIRFNSTFRGGDDRGRRGGGAGRPGGRPGGPEDRRKRTQANGGGSFTNRKQTAPKVDDINDFPSLGVAA